MVHPTPDSNVEWEEKPAKRNKLSHPSILRRPLSVSEVKALVAAAEILGT